MLAYYYQLKIKPENSSHGLPRLTKTTSRMRKLLLLFYVLIAAGTGIQQANAQDLRTFPDPICKGSFTTTSVSNLSVPFDRIEFDYDGDGTSDGTATSPSTSFTYQYNTSGAKTITAKIFFPGNPTPQVLTINTTVVTPPTASFNLLTNITQCFIGNVTEIENTSVKGDGDISEIEVLWGDVTKYIFPNPPNNTPGQKTTHSYGFQGVFTITMSVKDNSGCQSLSTATATVTIKNDITPDFTIQGTRGCKQSCYTFVNNTPIPFADVKTYTWDFGDGTTYTAQRPFVMPTDSINYHRLVQQPAPQWGGTTPPFCYTKPGKFTPSLYLEDMTGCKGRFTATSNLPENIQFTFDVKPTFSSGDTTRRADSVCYGTPHDATIFFRQTPIELAQPGQWLWTFDNPASMQLNANDKEWWPKHAFVRDKPDKCDFSVKLQVAVPPCLLDTTVKVRILAPKAQIEDKPVVQILPSQQTQCVITNMVEFPNTSSHCYAEHMWRKWDFGDDFAPRCTSFLVPNAGWPQPGGWVYNMVPPQALTNSHGYFIQNGITYAGKRVDCNFSHDSLPVHRYEDWAKIYEWYRDGHDFMPWDFNRYTRNPADTGSAPGSKIWVHNRDTQLWGKPVYMNISTGELVTTQGFYNDPIFGNIPYPRIDTITSQQPQDLTPLHRITIQRGVPDPFALESGIYNVIPRGTIIDPKSQPNGFQALIDGRFYSYPYGRRLFGQSSTQNFYEYIFYREIQKCHTVELELSDSLNGGSTGKPLETFDYLMIDTADCGHKANAQLALVRPDARGLGKSGIECTGAAPNGIEFRLDQSVFIDAFTGAQSMYPGINPNCGQTLILLNIDSLADRMDGTPCTLDGFTSWGGGTTLGGLNRPNFNSMPNWNQPPPAQWNAMNYTTKTSTYWHYGPNAPLGVPDPQDPNGYVTVGLVIGAGVIPGSNPVQPLCISDTVWYHNFLYFRKGNAAFYLDPTYNPVTNVPTTGICKEYCKNDEILFVYQDTTQDSIAVSYINWGDMTYTLDSFYHTKDNSPATIAQGYVNGLKRVRNHYHLGTCGFDPPTLYKREVFPHGVPGQKVDIVWHQNYYHRLLGANASGSLQILGPNTAGDSLLLIECNYQYSIAMKDTLALWYIKEVRDSAYGLWPVKHTFWNSTFENNCKQMGGRGTGVSHDIYTTKLCRDDFQIGLVIRGVIDSCMVRNSKGEFDTVFCVGEPVHFYDSVRYWRPDCIQTSLPFFPNKDWSQPGVLPVLGAPYNTYQFDTVNYWAREETNTNVFRVPQSFEYPYIEKMYWYFGDGDSATGTKPIHTYKNPGRYVVTMKTFDRRGCWDTSWCYVYISDPVAKAVVAPGLFNCLAPVELWDRSIVLTGGNDNADSVKLNFWWFGENKTADTLTRFDGSNTDTATWKYRKNGVFSVKLVVETFQGCKDTVYQEVFVEGPRPKIKLLTDTIGCAPFKVRVVNLADTDGPPTAQKLTRATLVFWGNPAANQSEIMKNQYDTVEFVYEDSGLFYIFVQGDDNDPPSAQNCPIVTIPDTVDNFEAPIRIRVMHSYPAKIEVNPQIVCVDQPFEIINLSDTIRYTDFKYSIYTGDTLTELDTIRKTNLENRFTTSIDSMGRFLVLLEPMGFAPGLPPCKRYDTVEINVVKPTALFDIDSSFANRRASEFKFTNTSTGADNYTWVAYKGSDFSNVYKGPEDVVQASPDWYIDMKTDTGDFIVCLTAFTADPAKPICSDSICKKIDFRFIVKMEIFNVFTPNEDGKNDVFNIDIEGETEYDLVIYNRWGTKVFESKDKQLDWNGKNMNDGSECPGGTYFYVFKYGLQSGKSETLNGSITLIRE